MAGSVNKVILIGNLGKDPEVRRMQDGRPIVNLSVATSETWRDKASGKVDLQGTVGAGETDRLAGTRFYLLVRRPAGLRITLNGRAVALPPVHNLRVLVTPQKTTQLRG